ncbi:hypothetical protein [Sandaracinus amylolyticus]|uniref:hypothetical protein n=1 Tax=Sandaracinus amylolyticus TaxID=927083 RepID=UPI001F3997D6|nr:hypothetical protein [Sandaracinus amylolyticus]UJR81268.1 Putative integron gene cassette protein [Sandaracinus amylolyticus]
MTTAINVTTGIEVTITRFVDAEFPGFVECRLVDAAGMEHLFVEKLPVVASEGVSADGPYPQPGVIACTIVAERTDGERALVIVDTDEPWGIVSTAGRSRFEVLRTSLVELEHPPR